MKNNEEILLNYLIKYNLDVNINYDELAHWFKNKNRIKIREIPYPSGKDKWVIWKWDKSDVYWKDVTPFRNEIKIIAFIEAFKILNKEENEK